MQEDGYPQGKENEMIKIETNRHGLSLMLELMIERTQSVARSHSKMYHNERHLVRTVEHELCECVDNVLQLVRALQEQAESDMTSLVHPFFMMKDAVDSASGCNWQSGDGRVREQMVLLDLAFQNMQKASNATRA